MSNLSDKKKRKDKLTNMVFGKNIVFVPVCDSTNELAKRKKHMPHGTVFLTNMQTNGKGRLGRNWESEKKSGIYMSLLLKPQMSAAKLSQITLIAGMAVCRALGFDTKIKWPNDVVIGSRKVCGILTEFSGKVVICGIGINVNTKAFPAPLHDKATSLLIETGEKHDCDYFCAAVLSEFESLYEEFVETGFESIYEQYSNLCINIDKEVRLIRNNFEITGIARGISPDGGLIVETEEGVFTVTTGEVSVRGMYGYI